MVKAALPVLVRVTGAVAGVPTGWSPKFTLGGESITAGAAPVPESEPVCGLFEALSVIVTAPFRMPATLGVNVTEIAHFEPAAKFPPTGQVLV